MCDSDCNEATCDAVGSSGYGVLYCKRESFRSVLLLLLPVVGGAAAAVVSSSRPRQQMSQFISSCRQCFPDVASCCGMPPLMKTLESNLALCQSLDWATFTFLSDSKWIYSLQSTHRSYLSLAAARASACILERWVHIHRLLQCYSVTRRKHTEIVSGVSE
jgi:hypothetical protein